MTSLAELISQETWAKLPDTLLLGCTEKLLCDLHPSTVDPVFMTRPTLSRGIARLVCDKGHTWNGGLFQRPSVEAVFKVVITGECGVNPRLGRWLHQQATTLSALTQLHQGLKATSVTARTKTLQAQVSRAIAEANECGSTEGILLPESFWEDYWRSFKATSRVLRLLPSEIDLVDITAKANVMRWRFRDWSGCDDLSLVHHVKRLSDTQQCVLVRHVHNTVASLNVNPGAVSGSDYYWSDNGVDILQMALDIVASV